MVQLSRLHGWAFTFPSIGSKRLLAGASVRLQGTAGERSPDEAGNNINNFKDISSCFDEHEKREISRNACSPWIQVDLSHGRAALVAAAAFLVAMRQPLPFHGQKPLGSNADP